jgi:nucleotide-binding universal stress UspA family protein
LTHAITLAEYSHSRLTLFTAVEQPPGAAYWGLAAPGMIGFLERADARANKIAHRARDRIPNDVPSAAVVTSRPVKPALVRQITDGHHDLVVVGYRGHNALRSVMLRSVSDYVLRHRAVPVLAIRAKSSRRNESPDFDLADHAPAPHQRASRVVPRNTTGSAANS